MNWIKSISDNRGGFDTFNWNNGDRGMGFAIGGLQIIVTGIIFSILLPIFLLIFYPLNNDQDRLEGIILTILVNIYVILDFSQGWILDFAFTNDGDENLLWLQGAVLVFNLSLVPINIIIFFYNGFIDRLPPPIFYGACIVTTYFIWYPLTSAIVSQFYTV